MVLKKTDTLTGVFLFHLEVCYTEAIKINRGECPVKNELSKEQYEKLTKKRRFRGLRLALRYVKDFLLYDVLTTVLSFLARHTKLVKEHKYNGMFDDHEEGPLVLPNIETWRGEYKVSYTYSTHRNTFEHWFYNKKGRILTVHETEERTVGVHEFRVELIRFEVRFNPFTTITVERPSMTFLKDIVIPERKSMKVRPFDPSESLKPVGMNHYVIDFSQARFGFKIQHTLYRVSKEEALENALKIIKRQLKEKDGEVNELLTGIKNDGEFVTPEGDVLAENMICSYCGFPAFVSKDSQEYMYRCIRNHKKTDSGVNVHKVDPIEYSNILGNSKDELYDLLF